MADTDKVAIPVELGSIDITKIVRQLETQLKPRMAQAAIDMFKGVVPPVLPTFTAQQPFKAGGKDFLATGKLSMLKHPEAALGEEGELDLEQILRFTADVKEVKKKISDSVALDAKRFRDFKKSIQFQPLKIKQSAITDFLAEFKGLEKSLEGKLPTNQLSEIRQFIDKSQTFKPQVRETFKNELTAFQESIASLSSDKQSKAIRDYVKKFGDQNNELRSRLDTITSKLRRQSFKQIKLENIDLPIEKRIQAYQDYADSGKEFAREARAEVIKLQQLVSRRQFKRINLQTELPIDDRIKALEQLIQKDPANDLALEIKKQIATIRASTAKQAFRKINLKNVDLSFEEKIKELEKFASTDVGKQIEDEIKTQISKIRKSSARQEFKRVKLSNIDKSVEDRIKALQDFAKTDPGKLFAEEINAQVASIRRSDEKQQFNQLKLRFSDKPINDRIKALEDFAKTDPGKKFADQIKSHISKLRVASNKQEFSQVKLKFAEAPIDERIKALEDFAKSDPGKKFADEIRNSIAKLRRTQFKQSFRNLKLENFDVPLVDRIKLLEEFAKTDIAKDFAADIRKEVASLKAKLSKKQFSKVKLDSLEKPAEERIKALEDFAKTDPGKEFADEIKRQITNIRKSSKRKEFTGFLKRIQTVDPQVAITELDTYINNRTNEFIDEAKLLQNKLRNQIKNANSQRQKDKSRGFANNTLIASGIGLGLLGNAGFPLLNIGFAAMSGGPVGAGIVALATGLGEGTRAINRFKDGTIAAARELGFVSRESKLVEARMKALDAVIGSASIASQRAGSEARFGILKDNVVGLRSVARLFSDLIETTKTTFTQGILGGKKLPAGDIFSENVQNLLKNFKDQRANSEKLAITELEDARRQLIRQLSRPTVGIENDPYEIWKRMQTAAFDPTKHEEIKIAREQLKIITELWNAAKEEMKKREADKGKWKIPPLFGTF